MKRITRALALVVLMIASVNAGAVEKAKAVADKLTPVENFAFKDIEKLRQFIYFIFSQVIAQPGNPRISSSNS